MYIFIYVYIYIYIIYITGPILESKGMRAIFSEKEQKKATYLKIWEKM